MAKQKFRSAYARDLIKRIEAAGGRVEKCRRSSHCKVYFDGQVTIISTAYETARHNTLAQLRRLGLDVG